MSKLDAKSLSFYEIGTGVSRRENFALSKAMRDAYKKMTSSTQEAIASAFLETSSERISSTSNANLYGESKPFDVGYLAHLTWTKATAKYPLDETISPYECGL